MATLTAFETKISTSTTRPYIIIAGPRVRPAELKVVVLGKVVTHELPLCGAEIIGYAETAAAATRRVLRESKLNRARGRAIGAFRVATGERVA